ncbi:sigma factor G inhibitor Gin [Alkalicella caledoniensis]|uniref:Sigma factor G inhibitor Gin n=1 Tax=Alkalicella caledoniensis TaxID=2731377 RepID=A0A7G9W895_ALKCA|nr:sigma factor G inhibitor Gin [Alkalicella caledoniensis]QNO14907.1 sigma factor G inhibitor Gin [Alkalicella caledoniensis]
MKCCSVCEENTDLGLGINILQSFICNTCLDKISSTQVDDPEYDKILCGIKRVWEVSEAK